MSAPDSKAPKDTRIVDIRIVVEKDPHHSRGAWEAGFRVRIGQFAGRQYEVILSEYDVVNDHEHGRSLKGMDAETARRVAAELIAMSEVLEDLDG